MGAVGVVNEITQLHIPQIWKTEFLEVFEVFEYQPEGVIF